MCISIFSITANDKNYFEQQFVTVDTSNPNVHFLY